MWVFFYIFCSQFWIRLFIVCMDQIGISSTLVRTDGSSSTVPTMRSELFYLGESSKLKKVNGCFPHSHDRPILVIPPADVMEDIDYWTKHALICKFLGI